MVPSPPITSFAPSRGPCSVATVGAYSAAYRGYFEEHRHRATTDLQALDPAPQVILDSELGLWCVGRTPEDAAIGEDLYRHTIKVVTDAVGIGGYEPVPLPDLFAVEYWDLEQAKLRRRGAPPPLAGEVALVTGGERDRPGLRRGAAR